MTKPEPDYEALGRYGVLHEKVVGAIGDLARKAEEMKDLLLTHDARLSTPYDIYELDIGKVRRIAAEIEDLNRAILENAKEANIYADRAGKTRFNLRQRSS